MAKLDLNKSFLLAGLALVSSCYIYHPGPEIHTEIRCAGRQKVLILHSTPKMVIDAVKRFHAIRMRQGTSETYTVIKMLDDKGKEIDTTYVYVPTEEMLHCSYQEKRNRKGYLRR